VPRLYFPVVASEFLDYDGLPDVYGITKKFHKALEKATADSSIGPLHKYENLTTRLDFVVSEYSVDGEFLGYHSVEHGRVQLCPDTVKRLDAAYDIGLDYRQKV